MAKKDHSIKRIKNWKIKLSRGILILFFNSVKTKAKEKKQKTRVPIILAQKTNSRPRVKRNEKYSSENCPKNNIIKC